MSIDLVTGVDRRMHREPGILEKMRDVVPSATTGVVVLVIILRPLDQILRGGDERVGSGDVVAQGVERLVVVEVVREGRFGSLGRGLRCFLIVTPGLAGG
jgi:hypothetical protein